MARPIIGNYWKKVLKPCIRIVRRYQVASTAPSPVMCLSSGLQSGHSAADSGHLYDYFLQSRLECLMSTKRIAYVTGGMGGIGTAICRQFCKQGYIVIAGCGPNSQRKDSWIANMKSEGCDIIASEGNVGDWF